VKPTKSKHKYLTFEALWFKETTFVATLTLGSRPKQGLVRAQAKREARECGKVWEWIVTLPSEFPFWELDSRWTPESLKSDWRGQNPSHWGVFYIIGNLLKPKCLKGVRMTHLDIWNASYGQKKGQEPNCYDPILRECEDETHIPELGTWESSGTP
jgi:hypothetical protein